MDTITLNREVVDTYDILEAGILIVDRNMQIEYCNPWIRSRLPDSLKGLSNLTEISEHYAYDSVLSRIKQVFVDIQPVILSPVFHKFVIPLYDTKDTGSFMYQQGVVKPVFVTESDPDSQKLSAFIQIFNVSNMQLQMRELEKANTDRKAAETQAKAAMRQADAANKAKSEFLANMSHELRTPLNAIIGFTEILGKKLGNSLGEKQQLYFNRIQESGEHLLDMVNDILDLSKIEANKVEIKPKLFDFKEMTERAASIVQAQASKKEIRIELNLQADLGWLNGDETRLKQVVYNLLSNAIKFTEPGKRIGIDATADDQHFLVTVWDEGVGIAEEHLNNIFDPFEQGHKEVSTESGTGLGLSISKTLIELHQGKITVESQLGQGSRFTITLPGRIRVDDVAEKPVSPLAEFDNHEADQDLIILITEDNDINREVMGEILEDYQVDFACTGEEAIEKASANSYGLILMDVQLPGINGIEAMKQIREILSDPPPIVALTAYAMGGDRERLITEGFDNYIPKPFDLKKLFKIVSQAAGKKSEY